MFSSQPTTAPSQRIRFLFLQSFRVLFLLGFCALTYLSADIGDDYRLAGGSLLAGILLSGVVLTWSNKRAYRKSAQVSQSQNYPTQIYLGDRSTSAPSNSKKVARQYQHALKSPTIRALRIVTLAHIILGFALLACYNLYVHFLLNISSPVGTEFALYTLSEQAMMVATLYLFAFYSTWAFWTLPSFVTVEAVLIPLTLIVMFQSQGNYQLELPSRMSDLAWKHGISIPYILTAVAVAVTVLWFFYLILAHDRPMFGAQQKSFRYGLHSRLLHFLFPIVVMLLTIGPALFFTTNYQTNIAQLSEGVGMKQEDGKSPLTFQSAVGKTKQPAALLRFENDYQENTWLPMLYLREASLSHYNGLEMVQSPSKFDTDVPRLKVGSPFTSTWKESGAFRKPITQSIFLLANHDAPFALDFPSSITPLVNPDPARFIAAYQAISLAPIVPRAKLGGLPLGDPLWTPETLAHYLAAPGSRSLATLHEILHEMSPSNTPPYLNTAIRDSFGEDLRYALLARDLTKDLNHPLDKIQAILRYLSKESLYTRAPGHTIIPGSDAVAPYLFSKEKRGYCVHFAHAAVYMFRLLGIPSRISTGYLTDLKYAKDGHVLLHLGDRHAWPEVYVYGHGWIVFDVSPERSENEAELVPDEKLLEELMSKIDNAKLLSGVTGTPLTSQKFNFDEPLISLAMLAKTLLAILMVMFIVLTLWKLEIYFAVLHKLKHALKRTLQKLFPSHDGAQSQLNNRRRIQPVLRAALARVLDLGLPRRVGETHLEYASRLEHCYSIKAIKLAELWAKTRYKPSPAEPAATMNPMAPEAIEEAAELFSQSLSPRFSRLRRLGAFFSPRSLIRYGRW